jgi:hypothetical protein
MDIKELDLEIELLEDRDEAAVAAEAALLDCAIEYCCCCCSCC